MNGFLIDGWIVFKPPISWPQYPYWVARKDGEEFTRRTLGAIKHEIAAHREKEEQS